MLYVDNITKTYKNTNENYIALDKISLSFNNQGLYFILGKSGSGKSTLLNIIGGIDKCDSGVITFENQIITNLNQKELNNYRKNSIGYIFQEFNLLTDLNVYDNIALSLKLQGKKENKNEILEILKEVDLEGFKNRKISELSGGQKQRVAIARALAKKPLIIIADEPTGALDSTTSVQIFQLLKKISKEHLIIVASHDKENADSYGDEIINIKDGKIESITKKTEFKEKQISIKENKSSSISTIYAFKWGLSLFKNNIGRLMLTVLLSIVCFTCLGVTLATYQYQKNNLIANEIEKNDYSYPFIINLYKYDNNRTQRLSITYDEIQSLKSEINYDLYGVIAEYGYANKNFLKDTSRDYQEECDALSLLGLSGYTEFNDKLITSSEFELIGNKPQNENDIVITKYFAETFTRYGYKYEDEEIPSPTINSLIGKTLIVERGRTSNDYITYNICGILDTKLDTSKYANLLNYNDSDMSLKNDYYFIYSSMSSIHGLSYLSNDGLKRLTFLSSNKIMYNYIVSAMPKNNGKIVEILNYLDSKKTDNTKYVFNTTTDVWINNLDTLLQAFKTIGGIAGLILLVFSGLFLFNFINLSINNKKKELGIIRSLGASGKDLLKIFSCESILIATINFIISTIITLIILSIINQKFKSDYSILSNVYSINFIIIIVMLLLSYVSCLISVIIPINKAIKKMPISTIS